MIEDEEQEYIDYMNAQNGINFDEFQPIESLSCPGCGKMIPDTFAMDVERPFTAKSPEAGLCVWGAYDVKKTVICEGDTYIHFRFDYDGSERLVLLNAKKNLHKAKSI